MKKFDFGFRHYLYFRQYLFYVIFLVIEQSNQCHLNLIKKSIIESIKKVIFHYISMYTDSTVIVFTIITVLFTITVSSTSLFLPYIISPMRGNNADGAIDWDQIVKSLNVNDLVELY